ncbi:MAG: hypothetical protein ACQEQO_11890 [Thermodesulfobacteriota bacterium]
MASDFIHLEILKEKITRALASREKPKFSYPRIKGKAVFPLPQVNAQSAITQLFRRKLYTLMKLSEWQREWV